MKLLINAWYRGSFWLVFLYPFAVLFRSIVKSRKHSYQKGKKASWNTPVPVIIVGNITVGGSGKTPLVIALVELLRQHGYTPGVVSRGYKGKAACYPLRVFDDTPTQEAGDEPVLIAKLAKCPVVVDPNRVAAAKKLLADTECNVMISDDGLQHYALGRDIEIIVMDGNKGLGNERCLPAGPLREPIDRLLEVDYRMVNGEKLFNTKKSKIEPYSHFYLKPIAFHNMAKNERMDIENSKQCIMRITNSLGDKVHAIAGIGNPQRFFQSLRSLGLQTIDHSYPDHHQFIFEDIIFNDKYPVVMTEKDAVKCQSLIGDKDNYWFLRVEAIMDAGFSRDIISHLKQLKK